MSAEKKAVILLSGGLDSATAGAMAKVKGYMLYALTIHYGQRHKTELAAAKKVAAHLGVCEHRFITVDMGSFGGSALTDAAIDIPKNRAEEEIGRGIPATYVPARNTVFLSLALSWAEVLGAFDIFIGVNALDYSGYPDCRDAFIRAFEQMANLATAAGVEEKGKFRIHTPLIHMSKVQIIQTGIKLKLDYSLTISCYDPAPGGESCGFCDACLLRKKGFAEAGVEDPAKP